MKNLLRQSTAIAALVAAALCCWGIWQASRIGQARTLAEYAVKDRRDNVAVFVASMAAVVNRVSADRQSSRVIMIGYSGGGALAVLMAPSVRGAAAVVTLAANLDIDAWVRWHGYLPLRGSLSPATEPPLSDSIAQWHLVGDQDQEVPPSVSLRYLERLSPDLTWHFASFDHICCWSEQWPAISKRINAALAARVAPPNGIP